MLYSANINKQRISHLGTHSVEHCILYIYYLPFRYAFVRACELYYREVMMLKVRGVFKF